MKQWFRIFSAVLAANLSTGAVVAWRYSKATKRLRSKAAAEFDRIMEERDREEHRQERASETSKQILAFARPELRHLGLPDDKWYCRVQKGEKHEDTVPVPVQMSPLVPLATLIPVELTDTMESPWGPLRYGVNEEHSIGAVSIMASQVEDLLSEEAETANAPE